MTSSSLHFICGVLAAGCIVSTAKAASPTEHWQVQGGNVTVVLDGDKPLATEMATVLVRIQHAIRWMGGWPAEYQPPGVLALSIEDATFEQYFGAAKLLDPDDTGHATQGIILPGPQATVLIYPASWTHNRAYSSLGMLYGRELLRIGPTAQWPACARQGMRMVLNWTRFTTPNEIYIPGAYSGLPARHDVLPLAARELFNPPAATADERARELWVYACYTLAIDALRAEPIPRAAYLEYFRLIAAGTDFDQAAQAAFGMSDADWQRHLRKVARQLYFRSADYDIRVQIAGDVPQWPDPEPMADDRLRDILTALAAKAKTPATP